MPAGVAGNTAADETPAEPSGLWGRAFRPFFLAAAIHAALVVPWWTLAWLGRVPPPSWPNPMQWHGHEMVFGFAAAVIAGFLLTASPVWTAGPVLAGRLLAALVALWAAGRIAMSAAGMIPGWLVAGLDVAFLPALAAAVLRTLRGSGQYRNHALVGLVLALAVANAAIHADALGLTAGAAGPALRFAVDGLVVLILVVGGRIVPAFTRNALRRRGVQDPVRERPRPGALAIGAAAGLALATPLWGRSPATGGLALVAGLAAAARMAGWQTRHTPCDPLLWSLHAGSAWVVAGLLLVAAGDLGAPVPATAGLHALTVGAVGGTILAVMTRVGVGHTGRPLELPGGVVWCYALVHGAALARVAAPFAGATAQRALLVTGSMLWAAAFGLFVLRYGPILTRPRPDGRPG